MRKLARILILIAAASGLSSCYYLARGSTQKITLQSNPPGAIVQVNDGQMGVTPCTLKVKREDGLTFHFRKAGYKSLFMTDRPSEVPPVFPATSRYNNGSGGVADFILFAGLVVASATENFVDEKTGALSSHPDEIDVQLEPLGTVATSNNPGSGSPPH